MPSVIRFFDSLERLMLKVKKYLKHYNSLLVALVFSFGILVIASVRVLAATGQSELSNEREHLIKGNNYLNRQLFKEAIEEYESVLTIDPGDRAAKSNIVLAHNNWGIAFFRQKKFAEARDQWNIALKLDYGDHNAKNNLLVLKRTLAKLGITETLPAEDQLSKSSEKTAGSPKTSSVEITGTPAPPLLGAQKPEEDTTPPAAVIILTPGIKQSEATAHLEEFAPKQEANQANIARESNNCLAPPAVTNSRATERSEPHSASTGSFVTPKTSASTPPSDSSTAGGSIEERLSAIELKVFGTTEKNLSIIDRIEKLEREADSHTSTGSITQRLQALAKTYGIDR